jgi:hypothetical protein
MPDRQVVAPHVIALKVFLECHAECQEAYAFDLQVTKSTGSLHRRCRYLHENNFHIQISPLCIWIPTRPPASLSLFMLS